jgi:hypothetical protein
MAGNSTGSPSAAASGAASSGAAKAGEGQASGWNAGTENEALANYLLWICAVGSALLIVWRVATVTTKHIRHVTSLTNDTQKYYAEAPRNVSWIKKNILYAPMFRKRRNREFQLSSAMNMGTLPTRFQFLFLISYLATNVAFCVVDIDFSSFTNGGKQLRNRSGVLSVVNMVRCPPGMSWLYTPD